MDRNWLDTDLILRRRKNAAVNVTQYLPLLSYIISPIKENAGIHLTIKGSRRHQKCHQTMSSKQFIAL